MGKKRKKILYIKAQWLGDIISGLPFLVEMNAQWHEVTQIFYDMNTLIYLYNPLQIFRRQFWEAVKAFKQTPSAQGRYRVLDHLQKQWLIHNILYIPFSIRGIFKAILSHVGYFDEAVITVGTRPARILGRLLAKKQRIIFRDTNDRSLRSTISDGELGQKNTPPLSQYGHLLDLPSEPYPGLVVGQYVVIYPSLFERSPEMNVWSSVIDVLSTKKLTIVLVGSNREQWFVDALEDIGQGENIINLLDKTTFAQMHWIVKHSRLNICCNGGVMRLANLVNKTNINMHTVSAYLMEPTVDNKHSFNIRPYTYPHCTPCEAWWAWKEGRIPQCVFFDTADEGACRKSITPLFIVSLIKKSLP